MSAGFDAAARREWREGWPLALSCLAGMTVASIALYVIGPLIAPIEAEFGWSRAQIMLGLTVSTLVGALLGPFVGMLLDRWGPRRIGLPGTVVTLVLFSTLTFATSDYAMWIALWLLISLGGPLVAPTVWTLAIASSFEKSRGLAIAVAMCGSAVAALVLPSLSTWLMDTYGWRQAVPMFCGIIGLVLLPVLWFGFRSKADKARGSAEEAVVTDAPPVTGVTSVRRAVASPQFVKLTLAAFLFTACTLGMVSNMVPVMSSLGFGRAEAAGIAGVLGIGSFTGRIATGYLIDRYNSSIIAGSVVLLPVISCVLLLNAGGSATVASLAVLIFGLSLGAEVDVIAFLAAQKFGTARFGTIFSFISAGWTLATAVGPLLISLSYDMTGDYQRAILLIMPAYVATSLLLFTIGRPLPFDEPARA
ncbi:MAG: MFS transporter [Novosphingobium sp.]|nr:MFS transporter [Novosphingobium sp.]